MAWTSGAASWSRAGSDPSDAAGPPRQIAPIALVVSTATLATATLLDPHLTAGVHLLLVLTGCVAFLVMCEAQRRWGGLTIGVVAVTAACGFAVAVAMPPRASWDILWYHLYGRMVAVHHVSPYHHVAADFPHDPIHRLLNRNWMHTPSVYGPLFTAISAVASAVLGMAILPVRLFYQLLALAAVGAGAVVIWRRTRSAMAVAFLTAHPVVAIYIVNCGRNDILVGIALLGAVVLSARGRDAAAGAVGGLGALIKLTGLVGIVGLVLSRTYRAGPRAGLRTAAGAGAVLGAGYLVAGPAALLTPMNTAGAMFSQGSLWQLAHPFGLPSTHVALFGLGVVMLVVLVRARRQGPEHSVPAMLTTLTLGAAYTLPGYAAWALPSAALRHDSKVSRIAAAQGVLLCVGYEIFRHPLNAPGGSALLSLTRYVVPAITLVLLVLLVRAAGHDVASPHEFAPLPAVPHDGAPAVLASRQGV